MAIYRKRLGSLYKVKLPYKQGVPSDGRPKVFNSLCSLLNGQTESLVLNDAIHTNDEEEFTAFFYGNKVSADKNARRVVDSHNVLMNAIAADLLLVNKIRIRGRDMTDLTVFYRLKMNIMFLMSKLVFDVKSSFTFCATADENKAPAQDFLYVTLMLIFNGSLWNELDQEIEVKGRNASCNTVANYIALAGYNVNEQDLGGANPLTGLSIVGLLTDAQWTSLYGAISNHLTAFLVTGDAD